MVGSPAQRLCSYWLGVHLCSNHMWDHCWLNPIISYLCSKGFFQFIPLDCRASIPQSSWKKFGDGTIINQQIEIRVIREPSRLGHQKVLSTEWYRRCFDTQTRILFQGCSHHTAPPGPSLLFCCPKPTSQTLRSRRQHSPELAAPGRKMSALEVPQQCLMAWCNTSDIEAIGWRTLWSTESHNLCQKVLWHLMTPLNAWGQIFGFGAVVLGPPIGHG